VIIDAADLDEGTTLDADLCIIGAGAAGITIARELAGTNLDVVVLESGGTEADEVTTSLYEGEYLAEPIMDAFQIRTIGMDEIRLRHLGGTTGHWAGYCRPIEPIAFQTRPWLSLSGWPITREDLNPFYERAAEVILLGPYRTDWQYWNDEHGVGAALLDDSVIASKVFQINFPMLFGEVYRGELEDAENVQVVLHANVTELVGTPPNADHIDSIEATTLDGRAFSVRARAYVVASGGIESARLLLASNGVNPAGIGNERDLVGRHFCEHLILPAGFAALARPPADASLYGIADLPISPDPERLIGVRGIFTVTGEAIRENEMLDWEAQLEIGTLPAGAPAQPDGVRVADVSPLLEQVDGTPAETVMYVQLTGEQIPRPENQVVLSDVTDALGQRRADLLWTIAPEERASMVTGLELLSQRLGAAGLGRLQYAPGGIGYNPNAPEGGERTTIYEVRPDDIDPEGFPVGVGYHHMCTLRMADDPSQGVVDADAKVHSVDNLWAAGSSVFSNAGASTPTMTIVALSLRLADHLRTQVLR